MSAPARSSVPLTTAAAQGPALRRLAAAAATSLPLPGLTASQYARGHALFEARSDQRQRITSLLCSLVEHRAARPTRVLSIGSGDGSVDVEVARALAGRGQQVDYAGIEPHGPAADRFRLRLASLRGVRVRVDQCTLDSSPLLESTYDVVLAVHSLYYVPDLKDALRAARRAVAPGGVLIVVHAPQEQLNQLVGVLAPDQEQEFSDSVARALVEAGEPLLRWRLDATLDLTSVADSGEQAGVLDFAVQVRVPVALRGLVVDVLNEAALPGPGLRVPHPVEVLLVRVPGGDRGPQLVTRS